MNRKLRNGRVDLAALDQPDAVAGQAGQGERPRVEHPGVPEVRDEHAALDAGDELGCRAVDDGAFDLAGRTSRAPSRRA